MRVLAADVGGTKTIVALAEVQGTAVTVLSERRFDSKGHGTLDELVRAFVAEHPATGLPACFGVAGPVVANTCQATNLPWRIDGDALGRSLGLGPTVLVNDFAAAALSIDALGPADLATLHDGAAEPRGPRAVLGAGTGLGEAVLVHTGSRYEVVPSEGGHGDFAPRNELEVGLLRHLLGRFPDHVSYERVVSGPGLVNVYDYLRDAGVVAEAPAVREAMAREDRGAVIGRHAVGGSDPLCVKAVELFGGVYGAEAGNLALKVLASGGVYLLGGIAAKILPCLEQGSFVAGYLAKGRLRRVVERYPVRVVINPRFGLLGAAVRASQVQA